MSEEKKTSLKHEIFSYVLIVVIAFILAFFLQKCIIVNALVPSGSMTSTIDKGDRLVGFRLSYAFSEPERGDIVIFKYPDDESQDFVKRIIGLPGDSIRIADGHLYVNGILQNESYINEPMNTNESLEFTVPADSYFMMGDNRNNSLDSRYWRNHFVSRDKIEAKVIFRYYSGEKKFISFNLIK